MPGAPLCKEKVNYIGRSGPCTAHPSLGLLTKIDITAYTMISVRPTDVVDLDRCGVIVSRDRLEESSR